MDKSSKPIRGYLPLKRPRNLTRQEKEYLKSFRLNPFNWLISKKLTESWLIVHRETGRSRTIPAP